MLRPPGSVARAPIPAPALALLLAGFGAGASNGQETLPRAQQPTGAAAVPGEKARFEFLKRSTAPGRILVIGTSDFDSDTTLKVSTENAILLQNAAAYMAAGNLASIRMRPFDWKSGTQYTLADDTRRVLGNLDEEVRLIAYLSGDVASDFADIRRGIVEVCRAFESQAKERRLKLLIVDPDANDQLREAAEKSGIERINLAGPANAPATFKSAFLGIVVKSGDRIEKLQVIQDTVTLEYDLIRRIAKVTRRDPVKIAWQVGAPKPLPMAGESPGPILGINHSGVADAARSDRHSPATDLHAMDDFMKEEYATTTVDLQSKIHDEVKVVVLCNVDGMSETQQFWTDQFLMRGGGLIVLADGNRVQDFGGAPRGNRNPFVRSANDQLPDDLFAHYGFTIHKDVVLDLTCAPILWQKEQLRYPPFVVTTFDGIDQSHPISANFRSLIFTYASSLSLAPKPGVVAIELVRSSEHARLLEDPMQLAPADILPDTQEKADAMKKDYQSRYVLAGLLEGEFESYFAAHPVPTQVIEPDPAASDGGSAGR
jgi:hypothetical protein